MAAVGMVLTASAQKTEMQMATLQNGNQTTVYYGQNALVDAYNAAQDTLGVIILSSGEFNVPTISKSVAIYGAGMEYDDSTGIRETYLRGSMSLIPADTKNEDGQTVKAGRKVNGIHLEGLHIGGDILINNNNNEPIRDLEVVKCECDGIKYYVSSYNNTIRQSVMRYGGIYSSNYSINSHSIHNNMLITNSWLKYVYFSNENTSTAKVDHCIIWSYNNYYSSEPISYTNSIIIAGNNVIPSTAHVSHCIFMNQTSYSGILGENNWEGLVDQGVWVESTDASYTESKTFALKYPDRYIGTDGTEVGLHGGAYPWNKISSIPRITECTIDTENAANGTIKVSIKAEAQTKE